MAGIWKSRWKAEYLMAGTWRDDERLRLFYQAVEMFAWSGRIGPAISKAAASRVNGAMWKLHAIILHHRAVDEDGRHGTVEAYMARSGDPQGETRHALERSYRQSGKVVAELALSPGKLGAGEQERKITGGRRRTGDEHRRPDNAQHSL